MILAIVDDLIFRVKLEAAAAHLRTPLTITGKKREKREALLAEPG
ncbi:MAG: hypothetical protein Q8R91_04730 [Candidatus Omnitrophota bacterium]|nr:hypothetical protein [Candidatus Omnitrophota bacterium]